MPGARADGCCQPLQGVPCRDPHAWVKASSFHGDNEKEACMASSPHPSSQGQLALSPPHPLLMAAHLLLPSTGVSLGFPTSFLPGLSASLALVLAPPSHKMPLHCRRRLCSRIKAPRQRQDAFAIAGTNSSGSKPQLQHWCSDPPS